MIGKSPIKYFSLYFHIPFCSRKCDYCHFFVLPNQDFLKKIYLESLKEEWKQRIALLSSEISNLSLVSIYFGGGTPYLLGPLGIHEILQMVNSIFPLTPEIEVTLEANPENILKDEIKEFASIGINRLSIGLQSLDDRLLKILNRTHDSVKALKSVEDAACYIQNLSVDLMYDIPTQSMNEWKKTLNTTIKLPIQHLSLYNLTFEPHTVFYKKRSQLTPLVPQPEESLKMFEYACTSFEQAGFNRYEISAFEKYGKRSVHNQGYWKGRSFIGFGPSAWSEWEGKRFRNIANIHQYKKQLASQKLPVDYEETLDLDEKIRERLAVELRLIEGIHLPTFKSLYGAISPKLYTTLNELKRKELIHNAEETLKLTPLGLLFHDTVAEELMA